MLCDRLLNTRARTERRAYRLPVYAPSRRDPFPSEPSMHMLACTVQYCTEPAAGNVYGYPVCDMHAGGRRDLPLHNLYD